MAERPLSPTDPSRSLSGPEQRLREITAAIPDAEFGERLGRVLAEAVRAIRSLGEMELGRYEEMSETGCPDLSLWEEMAPVIRNTVVDVNRLLTVVQQLFPPRAKPGDVIGRLIDQALANDEDETLARHKEETRLQIGTISNALVADISNLGERIRSPSVVSDRWNLLSDVQEFRGRFRATIGELIYLAVLPFASVGRADVVPEYAEEISESVASRRAVTDLARVMTVHHSRLREIAEGQLQECVSALGRDLDTFGRSRSYAMLRTHDKRRFVEFRAQLYQFSSGARSSEVEAAVGEFAQFAQGLSHINRRACLVEHDRQLFAACGVKLERADAARARNPAAAAALLADAGALAADLYGRHPSLDAWLRKAKKRNLRTLTGAPLDFEIELFRGLLAAAMAT